MKNTMKVVHYFFSPIYGKLQTRDICYFYVGMWNQKTMAICPDVEYWKTIYLPYCSDREIDMTNPIVRENIKKLIGGICLMKYLTCNISTNEPLLVKYHDVYDNDKLENVMDFLARIHQFQQAMFSESANTKDSFMPTTDRLRHSPGFEIFQSMKDREFDFIANILYQTGLFQKIQASTNDGNSLIHLKYARSITKNHIRRVAFTRFRTREIYDSKVKGTRRDKRVIRPIEFSDFIYSNS